MTQEKNKQAAEDFLSDLNDLPHMELPTKEQLLEENMAFARSIRRAFTNEEWRQLTKRGLVK